MVWFGGQQTRSTQHRNIFCKRGSAANQGLSGTDAACANPDFFTVSTRLTDPHILNVRQPASFGLVVRVADPVAVARCFAAYLAFE